MSFKVFSVRKMTLWMSVSPIFLCWQKSTFKEPKSAGILILHVFELTENENFEISMDMMVKTIQQLKHYRI